MVEMDFHGMKRKKLQALCKKHGIPANLKNKEMADRLSLIFQGKEVEDPVGSGNAGTKKNTVSNTELIDLVSPSPGIEERSDFSAKILNNSEPERLEFETNLSPEIPREGFEICGVKEDMKSGLNKEQVGNSQGGVCVHDTVHSVENRRCDVDTMCLDTPTGTMDIDGKTDVAVEVEVHSSSEVNSSELNILEMVVSGTATTNAETCEARFVSSPKMSLSTASERMIGLSPKLLNNSESKPLQCVTIFSLETLKADIEVCDVKENIQIKEQIGNNPEVVLSAPNEMAMSDEDLEQVPSEEFGDRWIDGKVEKLSDKNNFLEVVCENGEGREEIVKQGDRNSPQESNIENVNVLNVAQEESGYPLVEEIEKSVDNIYDSGVHNLGNSGCEVDAKDFNRTDSNISQVTHKEFGYHLVEGEVHKSDDRVYVHDAVHNVESGICDVDTMCLDTSTGTMHIDEKTDVAVEDDVHSSNEVNSTELNILEMVVSGTASRNAETCEARFVSSPKMNLSPASERMIGLSPKLLNNSESKPLQSVMNFSPETLKIDIEVCDVMENIQIDVKNEQDGRSQEVVHAASNAMAMSDEDLEQVPSEDFGDHSIEGEVDKLSDKNNLLEDVCENGKGSDEAVEKSDHNSPQGSYMKNVNVLHVSQEESGYALVEEVQKSDDNIYNGGVYNIGNSGSEVNTKDIDVIINLTTEHFAADVPNVPSNFKYLDGTPDLFLRTSPLNEINCSGVDIQQDTCEEELQKTVPIACPRESIGLSPNMTTVEQFIDEVRSSTFEDSDGTPVQFVPNDALNEVKSNHNICEIDVPGIVIGNKDTSEAKFVSSCKKSLSPTSERMIGFSPKQLNNSETEVLQSETNFFPETSRVVDIGICDVEENMRIGVNKEQVDDNQQVLHAASSVTVSNIENLVQVASAEVGENLLEGEVEKSGLIADPKECIGILLDNVESSLPPATEDFLAESHFDPSTLNVGATCNMQNDQTDKEYSQEVLHMANELVVLQTSLEESNSVEGEFTRLFDNSDDHEDVGVTEAEDDKNQHYTKRDMDIIEKYILNEFQSIDDASGLYSDQKPNDYAPTMPEPGEMKSCTFNFEQISASGTVSGDEGTFQEKLETPPKCTPIASLEDSNTSYPKLLESSMKKELKIVKSLPVKRARDVLGTSDMKENIKIAKMEQVGTVISKSAFPKRKPLQDLQQN